jgi:hypothetical protein
MLLFQLSVVEQRIDAFVRSFMLTTPCRAKVAGVAHQLAGMCRASTGAEQASQRRLADRLLSQQGSRKDRRDPGTPAERPGSAPLARPRSR